ncbi:hypothetical protein KsCSTR_12750 [Candidatus Kuenenia stuttgartiensis]|jgi:hypothetical protein|uniref:Uncharacterized protein n=1 Tax=Kuenenia stuttgartiensis TaxID=174633 RepID=Q1Q0U3_KUEST|nr:MULTISPECIES: hypothetical protein [Kuenenia]MBZ0191618.1 hypothetical protein [Candidatus Kuenenia stuttgartiensis]MCZ7624409.1 hypothetical protein [Candidatus Kuenenia sp.]QII10654.1 hypothetical protein KsCSTR_12750 [Candidatus Kuenenia stuttgartiensis]TVL99802.1 MAG: hypothetical protein CV080_07450 [Candidatus Kuenenia stuttgartiensis]CAJ73621.1 unknown protein [Candidatus Kuenenia stuttgartiensis]
MYHPEKQKHCRVKPDELVTLIKKHYADKIRHVTLKFSDGSEVSDKTYTFDAELNGCNECPFEVYDNFGKMEQGR